jgi:hypothetical protein
MPKKKKKPLTIVQATFVLHGMVATIQRIKFEAISMQYVADTATEAQKAIERLITDMGG